MKGKVENVTNKLVEAVSAWKGVDTITLFELVEDVYDPYFFISMDIYYRDTIPGIDKRKEEFSYVGAFESTLEGKKDRFFVDDVPVRLEYKDIRRFEEIVYGEARYQPAIRGSGSYMFYRLANGKVLYKSSDWIDTIKEEINSFPDQFWENLRQVFQSRMEHHLSDIGAAVMRDDELFYMISLSEYVRSIVSTLFAINHRFEPSGRMLFEQVMELDILPDPFGGRFDSLLRNNTELTPDRKREIAELIAKSIINL
jgi:hypothetical protein